MKKMYFSVKGHDQVVTFKTVKNAEANADKELLLKITYDLDGKVVYKKQVTLPVDDFSRRYALKKEHGLEVLGEYASITSCLKHCRGLVILRHREYDYDRIEAVVCTADSMKNAYFFKPREGRSFRDSYDDYHSAHYEWDEGGHHWYASFQTNSTSCHVYTSRDYRKDDECTNLKAIKNSMKRVWEEVEALRKELGIEVEVA